MPSLEGKGKGYYPIVSSEWKEEKKTHAELQDPQAHFWGDFFPDSASNGPNGPGNTACLPAPSERKIQL